MSIYHAKTKKKTLASYIIHVYTHTHIRVWQILLHVVALSITVIVCLNKVARTSKLK